MRTIIIILTLVFSFQLESQIPNYVPSAGLQGFWPFTGNANDLTANANHGTVNGASLTLDRFNAPNRAYSFNGFSDFISTNYTGILGSGPRAVSFWAKTTESVNSMYAVGWGDNGQFPGGQRFGCAINAGGNGPAAGGGDCYLTYNPTSPISNNTWHHYVFQFNGTDISHVKIYHNGTLLTQTISVYQPNLLINTVNTFNVHFGKIDYAVAPAHFAGEIDEIGIWNRVLTTCEIKELYQSTKTAISISTSTNSICRGEMISLNATGVSSYTWNTSSNAASINVSPIVTTTYTVSGTSTLTGCTVTNSITITVNECTGLFEQNKMASSITIYPNPSNGNFTIKGETDTQITITNTTGQMVDQLILSDKNLYKITLKDLSEGVYFISGKTNSNSWRQKLIITK